ncbi:MAG: ABC transporter substrate-binding protein, partial [Gammaproteobacteria bacterium]|nr:ABC transporter substrate-binding protein [Gammaproteobacteria bacterium]
MRNIKISLYFALAAACFLLPGYSVALDKGNFSTTPVTNNGKKWRIGYYEGGEYIDYQKVLQETAKGLMRLGWIETTQIPVQSGEKTDALWHWLGKVVKSDYIEFVSDAHYSANWDDKLRKSVVDQII